MTYVKLGNVHAFPGARPDKEQALKVLEEAAEVFGAWQVHETEREWFDEHQTPAARIGLKAAREDLLDEISDTIQACANLAAALGVDDLTPYLAECEERNRERGRYE